MSLGRYALIVSAVLLVSLATLVLVPGHRLGAASRQAALLGALLAGANTLAAYSLATWSEQRSNRAFFVAVLGGMAARMAFMLGAVVAAVVLAGLPSAPLAISLLSHFALFLVLELAFLHRRTSRRTQGVER